MYTVYARRLNCTQTPERGGGCARNPALMGKSKGSVASTASQREAASAPLVKRPAKEVPRIQTKGPRGPLVWIRGTSLAGRFTRGAEAASRWLAVDATEPLLLPIRAGLRAHPPPRSGVCVQFSRRAYTVYMYKSSQQVQICTSPVTALCTCCLPENHFILNGDQQPS